MEVFSKLQMTNEIRINKECTGLFMVNAFLNLIAMVVIVFSPEMIFSVRNMSQLLFFLNTVLNVVLYSACEKMEPSLPFFKYIVTGSATLTAFFFSLFTFSGGMLLFALPIMIAIFYNDVTFVWRVVGIDEAALAVSQALAVPLGLKAGNYRFISGVYVPDGTVLTVENGIADTLLDAGIVTTAKLVKVSLVQILDNGFILLLLGVLAARLTDLGRKSMQEDEKNIISVARMEKQIAENESVISKAQNQLVISQISPHFFYNCLATISALCEQDPHRAKEMTEAFADYMRGNLNTLKEDKLIPFKQELEHTMFYLRIEQTRFGDDLKVEYEINVDDFMLPALTIQPIVENAVKHGICNMEDGGTVKITTRETRRSWVICVADDGPGFTPGVTPDDGRTHVGMQNVKERLRIMCGGQMQVDSAPGKGTKIYLMIPKDKQEGAKKG